jgi:UPF0755 protein
VLGLVKKLLIFCVVAGALLAGGLFYYGKSHFEAPGPSAADGATETVILLKPGLGVRAIAAELYDNGLIRDPRIFEIAVRLQRAEGQLKAGEYSIPTGASMAQIADILQSGKSILHKLTIAEGLTSAQIVRLVEADPVLLGNVTETPVEGALLPETYLFIRGSTRDDILQEMQKAQQDLVYELWQERAEDLPFTTAYEAVILASIVEKETSIEEERPRIAAVFVNRLNRGIRLQSDPTIIYGLTKGEPLGRGIRQSELKRETPYNTYVIDGLPPTPIANPGAASLRAVLNPPKTNELFFVADGTGGHVFASTLAQHKRNVSKWRRIERQQNGN